MGQNPRLRRSLLFVPGADPRKLERARTSGADTVILDLEDAIAPGHKSEARMGVAEALARADFGEMELAARINPPQTPFFEEDLDAVVGAGARCLMLPKVETAEDIEEVAQELERAETRHGYSGSEPVRFLALVETPAGIIHAASLATASSRVEALCFGHADFSRGMGLTEGDPSRGTVHHARCQLAIAAKACEVLPIDTVCLAVRDAQAFRADAELGRDLGFEGKMCIHPTQVAIANQVYTPTTEEIERARKVVAAWEQAVREGQGVFTVDDQMVDAPLVAIQERVLERARRAGKL
jgi:citrate lyase subunit beta/citryl-CoA lyase